MNTENPTRNHPPETPERTLQARLLSFDRKITDKQMLAQASLNGFGEEKKSAKRKDARSDSGR
jgi:hypothetical protein